MSDSLNHLEDFPFHDVCLDDDLGGWNDHEIGVAGPLPLEDMEDPLSAFTSSTGVSSLTTSKSISSLFPLSNASLDREVEHQLLSSIAPFEYDQLPQQQPDSTNKELDDAAARCLVPEEKENSSLATKRAEASKKRRRDWRHATSGSIGNHELLAVQNKNRWKSFGRTPSPKPLIRRKPVRAVDFDQVGLGSVLESNPTVSNDCLKAAPANPTPASSALTPLASPWRNDELNEFYSCIKNKWPAGKLDSQGRAPMALLLKRFRMIANRLPSRSAQEIQLYYEQVLRFLKRILDAENEDISVQMDLQDPNVARIALWSWFKATGAGAGTNSPETDLTNLKSDAVAEPTKTKFLKLLLSALQRSRQSRQRKQVGVAKTSLADTNPAPKGSAHVRAGAVTPASGDNLAPEENRKESTEICSSSNNSINSAAIVHTPLVRKKRSTGSPDQMSCSNPLAPTPTEATSHVRGAKRSLGLLNPEHQEALDLITPKKPKKSPLTSAHDDSTILLISPVPVNKKAHVKIHRKFLRVRLVPKDEHTRKIVEKCACNPKVELRMTSTKKLSEVLGHMNKKWALVQRKWQSDSWDFDLDGQRHGDGVEMVTQLRLFPKPSTKRAVELKGSKAGDDLKRSKEQHEGWGMEDGEITCWHLMERWGSNQKLHGDSLVTLLYTWVCRQERGLQQQEVELSPHQSPMPLAPPAVLLANPCVQSLAGASPVAPAVTQLEHPIVPVAVPCGQEEKTSVIGAIATTTTAAWAMDLVHDTTSALTLTSPKDVEIETCVHSNPNDMSQGNIPLTSDGSPWSSPAGSTISRSEAPGSALRRRRIKPTLVAHQEIKL